VIDSTIQNPSYTYTTAGIYTVSLTVSYGGLGTSTETKKDYIKVGDAGVGVPGATHTTIGGAIAAAPPGGIVVVSAGTYTENININKAGLKLIAGSRPVIDGNVIFDAPNILVQGFEITGKLITTVNAKDETVKDCKVYGKELTELLFDIIVNAGESIQAAVNAASSGDTIMVAPGTYPVTSTIDINKPLTLISETGDYRTTGVTLTGGSEPYGYFSFRDNFITNTSTSGGPDEGAITIYPDATHINIINNTLTGNARGFAVRNKPGVVTEVHVNFNNIFGNGSGAVNLAQGGGIVDATNNWWGDASGPNDAADDAGETTEVPPCTASPASEKNADGLGNSVVDTSTKVIDYCPWATAPF
jgi:PKD repeat protein